jgi:hypothetical protein
MHFLGQKWTAGRRRKPGEKIAENYRLLLYPFAYLFDCATGYIEGEVIICPIGGGKTEVYTASRYYRLCELNDAK